MPARDEVPSPETEAMAGLRVWRESERKSMIEAIGELISQARKAAKSPYTRSAKKAQWTRLAGQLIWYKDQILRAMTYEAMEHDIHDLKRRVLLAEEERERAPPPSSGWIGVSPRKAKPEDKAEKETEPVEDESIYTEPAPTKSES